MENVDYLGSLNTENDDDRRNNMKDDDLKVRSYIQLYVESSDRNIENYEEFFNIMSVLFLSNIT